MATKPKHPNEPLITSAIKAVTQAEQTLRAIDLRTVAPAERTLHKDARAGLANTRELLRSL